ncbi:ATPase [Aureococcus anophagefferens]|nr:ATPase [Aureococcus anophagefferens]
MEFTEELIEKPICNLSGGWKMKLALARAVLLNADLLLLDEPTNHLGVQKQAWLCDFLTGPVRARGGARRLPRLKFLNKVLTDVIHYENMRLKRYTGNLDQFVEQCPMAKAYFSIHDTEMKFTFPVPGPLEGVKSKTKAIIQAKNISFTYPGAKKATLVDVSCQLSQASRVACIGPNGAGKSTLIKALVGETKPDAGSPEIYRHQNCRVAYVAQHAFHHIEQHLEMSPVEYIQWRFSGGLDKEQQAMEASQMTDEEKAKLKQVFVYEVKWANKGGTSMGDNKNLYVPKVVLESNGFFKLMKAIDDKIAAEAGNVKPLDELHPEAPRRLRLHEEFGTYGKMKNLSGGQKVNRRTTSTATSLGALAIKDFEGGVLMISHNAEFFGDIAPEVWEVPGDQKVHISGAEWMEAVRAKELAEAKAKKKARRRRRRTSSALGNKIESVTAAADVDRDMIKRMTKQLKSLKDRLKKGDGSKEKAAAKAEKDAQKALEKKAKKSADKKSK